MFTLPEWRELSVTLLQKVNATTWEIGSVNVLATLIGIAFIDRLWRRRLPLVRLAGTAISLVVLGVVVQFIIAPAPTVATALAAGGAPVVAFAAPLRR